MTLLDIARDLNRKADMRRSADICACIRGEQSAQKLIGDTVVIRDGGIKGTVKDINVLRQQVSVLITGDDDTDIRTVHVNEISFQNRRKARPKLSAEEIKEMKELEAMEKGDKDGSKLD